jgi:hypothetical protein
MSLPILIVCQETIGVGQHVSCVHRCGDNLIEMVSIVNRNSRRCSTCKSSALIT